MNFEGTLKTWHDDRGFGFIAPDQGGQEIFVHIKAYTTRTERPRVGQRVSFTIEIGPQGKKRAAAVSEIRPVATRSRPAGPDVRRRPAPRRSAPPGFASLFILPVFLMVWLAVAVLWRPPAWLALAYLGFSLASAVAYAVDKNQAIRDGARVREDTLHALALLGGWPGALLAQQFLRHKSVKAEFRQTFWATVMFNMVAFVGFSVWQA